MSEDVTEEVRAATGCDEPGCQEANDELEKVTTEEMEWTDEAVEKEKAAKVIAAHVSAAIVIAARTAHEANRAYCRHLGDDGQPPWAEASRWQKESCIVGVRTIIANPSTTPAQSHSMWMAHKGAEGWVYGEKKSEGAKTHPCMVPFDSLPPEQRFKDVLFAAVVRGVLGVG